MPTNLQASVARLSAALLFTLFAVSAAIAQSDLTSEADALFERRGYFEAAKEYQAIGAKIKSDLTLAGYCYYQAGEAFRLYHKPKDAIENYQKALGLKYGSRENKLFLMYGDCLRDIEEFEDAIDMYEKYIMKRQIEARIVGDMATNIVLPAAIAYQNMLIDNIAGLSDLFGKESAALTSGQREILQTVSTSVSALHASATKLRQERAKINKIEDFAKRASKYGSVVTPLIEQVGEHCARLEQLVDNEIWPLPKFQEMLFTR